MKTVKRFKTGDAIPERGTFIRTEIVNEPLSASELSDMGWPGIGPWPTRAVHYAWYEVPIEPTKEAEES